MNKIDLFIKHKLLITKPKTYLLTKMNDIIHIENFIDSDEATHIFNNLKVSIEWNKIDYFKPLHF